MQYLIPGVEITRAGKTYTVPPLSLAALQAYQKQIEAYSKEVLSTEALQTFQLIVLAAFRRNYPEMTHEQLFGSGKIDEKGEWREESAGILDVSDILELMDAVMDISGLKRKAQAEGKALAGSR